MLIRTTKDDSSKSRGFAIKFDSMPCVGIYFSQIKLQLQFKITAQPLKLHTENWNVNKSNKEKN